MPFSNKRQASLIGDEILLPDNTRLHAIHATQDPMKPFNWWEFLESYTSLTQDLHILALHHMTALSWHILQTLRMQYCIGRLTPSVSHSNYYSMGLTSRITLINN